MLVLLRQCLIACGLTLFFHLTNAAEVVVLGNDPQLVSSSGSWDYAADICPKAGFLASTTRGSFATLIFNGTFVSVGLLKVHDGSLATVYLDGAPLASNVDLVDTLAQSYQCITQDVNATQLSDTSHNLTIVHAGKSPNSPAGQADWLVLIEIVYTTTDIVPTSSSVSSGSSTTDLTGTFITAPASASTSLRVPESQGVKATSSGLIAGSLVEWSEGCYLAQQLHGCADENAVTTLKRPPGF